MRSSTFKPNGLCFLLSRFMFHTNFVVLIVRCSSNRKEWGLWKCHRTEIRTSNSFLIPRSYCYVKIHDGPVLLQRQTVEKNLGTFTRICEYNSPFHPTLLTLQCPFFLDRLFWKKLAKLFKIVISNPFQSSPSSAILVPCPFGVFLLWQTIIFRFLDT